MLDKIKDFVGDLKGKSIAFLVVVAIIVIAVYALFPDQATEILNYIQSLFANAQ